MFTDTYIRLRPGVCVSENVKKIDETDREYFFRFTINHIRLRPVLSALWGLSVRLLTRSA